MHRAAIVRSQVLLSFDIRRVKGHVIESLLSPNISILLLLCKNFCTDFFSSGQAYSIFLFFFFSLSVVPIPLSFPYTQARAHAQTHMHTHTHTQNLYVSDIQQGKDKGTELITHHLLLLRRTDGSRRYVNGKGQ